MYMGNNLKFEEYVEPDSLNEYTKAEDAYE